MATEPTVCDEIHPAVTHAISWQVAATPHTSENYKVGYYQQATNVDAVQKFREWLTSEGVTGTPVVIGDGHVRTATWFNNNYENPVYHTCEYILRSSGIGNLQVFDGTYNAREFRNLRPYQYAGNSSEGSVIIDYNTPYQGQDVIMRMPFVIALNAIRAIDHVDATIATAYPMATRVLPAPPPPLTEGLFDLDESISLTAKFKLFVEYQGPDRQKSMWIDLPSNMWTYALGKNRATADWGYDYKPYKTISQITTDYYGSNELKEFFFDNASTSQIMEGEYKTLTYPWRQATDGNVTYQFPDSQSFNVSLSGESGAIGEFSNFYKNEAYLHNHVWNVKFIRYIALDCEIVTIPPLQPKITEFTHWIETLQSPNTGSNATTYPYVYQYKLHLSYKATYAKEVTRYEMPSEVAPVFETFDLEREFEWTGATYENLPTPVVENTQINLLEGLPNGQVQSLVSVNVNLFTNTQIDGWGFLSESEHWNPEKTPENGIWNFFYKFRVRYINIGKHQPENIPATGWTDWMYLNGAPNEDKPGPIPPDFYAVVPNSAITYKAFGIYEEGSHVNDREVSAKWLYIDCLAIGGINPSILDWEFDVYKTNYPWPGGLIF